MKTKLIAAIVTVGLLTVPREGRPGRPWEGRPATGMRAKGTMQFDEYQPHLQGPTRETSSRALPLSRAWRLRLAEAVAPQSGSVTEA